MYDSTQNGTHFKVYEDKIGSEKHLRFVVRHNGDAWEAKTASAEVKGGRIEYTFGDPVSVKANDRYDYNKIAEMLNL